MNHMNKMVKVTAPSGEEKNRKKKHIEHLEYFYGDYWSVFMDKNRKCYLEIPIGTIWTEWVIREISLEDYISLKEDESRYLEIEQKVLGNES